MQDGHDARDAEPDEHEGPVGPPLGGAEVLEPGDDDAARSEEEHLWYAC